MVYYGSMSNVFIGKRIETCSVERSLIVFITMFKVA